MMNFKLSAVRGTTALLRIGCAAAILAVPQVALAAGGTDIEAGFASTVADLQALLDGSGGALILLISVIAGIVTYVFTQRWGFVLAAFVAAFMIAYGLDTVTGVAGVTASVEALGLDWSVTVPTAPILN